MKSYRFLSIILLFFLMISAYCTAKADEIEQIEYQVYKAVVEQEYLNQSGYIDMINKKEKQLLPKTIIIINQTIQRPIHMEGKVDELLKRIKVENTSFPEYALESWKNKNKKQYFLKDEFKFTSKHLLISEKQREEAFLPTKWWDSFYKHYPNALGYFRLSRVGFDTDENAAIVYIENSQDGKWGSGTFWLLKNDKGKWVCTGSLTVWLS